MLLKCLSYDSRWKMYANVNPNAWRYQVGFATGRKLANGSLISNCISILLVPKLSAKRRDGRRLARR